LLDKHSSPKIINNELPIVPDVRIYQLITNQVTILI
jgi:hypothetical protein